MSFALCCCWGGGRLESGVTARIGTGSQESEFLISLFLFLLLALAKGCESFSPQPVIPHSDTSWPVLSAECPYPVLLCLLECLWWVSLVPFAAVFVWQEAACSVTCVINFWVQSCKDRLVLQLLNSPQPFTNTKLFAGLLVHHVQTDLQVTFETLSQISESNGVMCLCTSDGESCGQKSPLSLMSCSLGLLEKYFYIFVCRKWICFGLNSNLAYSLLS